MLTDTQIRSCEARGPSTQACRCTRAVPPSRAQRRAVLAVQLPIPGQAEDACAWAPIPTCRWPGPGAAPEARRLLAEGIDPAAEKQVVSRDFETVARAWYERWKVGRHPQYAFYVLKRLETDIFPSIGTQPVSEVPASAFREAVQKIEQRGAAEIAKRVLQNCAQIMRYAVANDLARAQSRGGCQARRHPEAAQEAQSPAGHCEGTSGHSCRQSSVCRR